MSGLGIKGLKNLVTWLCLTAAAKLGKARVKDNT